MATHELENILLQQENVHIFIPMWEHNSWFPTTFFTLEEAKENARTWEYPCDDLGNWDEDEIEIFEMILTKPLPKNRMLRNIDLPEYGKIINKHYIF